jgi:[ribosomal protein S5]-alanine N-acetyltransferase
MKAAIRPIQPSDEQQFISAARRSTHLHKPWISAPCDPAAFAKYIARFTSPANLGFVAYAPASNNIVGAVNITNIIFGVFRSGYLGYFAFAGHEGKGYMKTGLRAVIRHAFNEGGLHRLEANIQPGNTASIALARSCGFIKEGYSPAYLKIGGQWRDHERWALVRGKKNAA